MFNLVNICEIVRKLHSFEYKSIFASVPQFFFYFNFSLTKEITWRLSQAMPANRFPYNGILRRSTNVFIADKKENVKRCALSER